jgi:hypothetical protein
MFRLQVAFALALGSIVVTATLALGGPTLPAYSPSNFSPGAAIDNPYYPLTPGRALNYSANLTDTDTGKSILETSQDATTNHLDNIGGVMSRAVHSRTWDNGILIEDTTDWFAQDKTGNVWYMGESTKSFTYDNSGKLIGTDTSGSWRTGVHGAKPGFIMPAHPTVGMSYFQEFSPVDQAEDQAQVLSRSATVKVPVGTFSNVIKTLETSPLEPDVRENKYYAKGFGIVLDNDELNSAGIPLNSAALVGVSNAVPLPPAIWIGSCMLALLACVPWKTVLGK